MWCFARRPRLFGWWVDERLDLRRQGIILSEEAPDHRSEKRLRIHALEIERVARIGGQEGEEGGLRAAVAIAKRVDRIELRQEVGGVTREGGGIAVTQEGLRLQPAEQTLELAFDVFRIAERTAVLERPDPAGFARPVVDVLEQMPVDRQILPDRQASVWERLFRPLRDASGFVVG